MGMSMRARGWWMAALLSAGTGIPVFAPEVEATTVKQLSLEQMVRGSHRIMLGRRVSQETYWNKTRTRIYTATRFAVTEDLKGESRGAATVVTVGGTMDGLTQVVSGTPRFREHEEVLLFLEAGKGSYWILMGLSQGMFRIATDPPGSQDGLSRFLRASLGPGFARIVLPNTYSRSGRAGSAAEQDPATCRHHRQVTGGVGPRGAVSVSSNSCRGKTGREPLRGCAPSEHPRRAGKARRLALLCLLAAVFAWWISRPPALAFVPFLSGAKWKTFPVVYKIHQGGLPSTGNRSEFVAIHAGFEAWQRLEDSAITFAYGGATEAQVAALDGTNLISFQDDTYDFGSRVVAVTLTSFRRGIDPPPILDADILFSPNEIFSTSRRPGHLRSPVGGDP